MEDNINMDRKEIGYENVDWIHLARSNGWILENTTTNIRVVQKVG